MPGLKDFLKKKEKIGKDDHPVEQAQLAVPEFKFIRTTTESEDLIEIPSYPDEPENSNALSPRSKKERKHHFGFRKSSNAEETKDPTAAAVEPPQSPTRPMMRERKLSERLRLHRQSRSPSAEASTHLPSDLPDAPAAVGPLGLDGGAAAEEEKDVKEQREAQWEKRATILAQANPLLEQERRQQQATQAQAKATTRSRSRSPSISDERGDENIQEAIRLHEIGELGLSTAMFGRLGDPKGANNALAQVLYGLALRHGWGVPPEPEKAIHYLSLAASNSASVERAALESGMKKGGAAKGELVLAIYELANCFRHGWGVKKDAVAARNYYETAANLGDTDAMELAAWCYEEGFGGGKDKVRTSRILSRRQDAASAARSVPSRFITIAVLCYDASPELHFPQVFHTSR